MSLLSPHYTPASEHSKRSGIGRLRRLLLKPAHNNSVSSLIDDKHAKMFDSGQADPADVINCFQSRNQVVLLLQKGQSFPAYPHELQGCVRLLLFTFVPDRPRG